MDEQMVEKKGGGMKAVVWVIIIALVAWGIYAVSHKSANDTGPIKVGVALPLTGDGATYGEPARNMIQMATDEINATGGINGRQIELVIEDSKCNGKDGANATQKLISVDKVQVITGYVCSSESLASFPIAEKAGVALFSSGATSPALTGASKFFARDIPSDASQGKVLADIAYNDKGWKTVAFLQEQTDYALGIYNAFNDEFTKLGGKVTKEEFKSVDTDFRSPISKLKDGKPDALFIDVQTVAPMSRILGQIAQLAWKPSLIINDVPAGDPETISKNSKVLEGALTAEFGTNPANPKFAQMIANYKAKFGNDVPYQSYAQTEYDSIYLLKDALLAVGNDGTKISEFIRNTKDWDGASGKLTILPTGDRDGGHTPEVITGGKKVPYVK